MMGARPSSGSSRSSSDGLIISERAMAPMFCEGDRTFFDKHQPDITLERPQTLSQGGALCDFQFTWVE